ncbi:MAG TPA: histidine kinase [Cyclobacteriaceae bacterium]|nr:histidine kinase [Cyclobacteriaceae bacterium]
MNRIKRVFRLIHIVLWILFGLLVTLQLWTDGHPYWLTLTVGFILTCLYVFYSHFYLLTQYLGKKKMRAYFLRLAGILLTGPLPLFLIYHKNLETSDLFFETYSMNLVSTVPIFLFLSWLARITETLVLNTIRKEQLEKQAVEAELFYLKSQINPHFLFNTLNNIHTLVYKQAATAPEAVLRLSSLMRYMIYESNGNTVPLSREITYLQDYIGLQQLRYKNAPVVDLEIVGDTDLCFIAPLLFIHFLENAYKHSPARLEPGDIRMKVEVNDNTLVFSIRNPVVTKQANFQNEHGGIGLPNIRKRLALLYPAQHTLEINSSPNIFTVTLTIHDFHLQGHERKIDMLYN